MSKNFEYDEAFRQCVEYFGGDDLAANVFLTKYASVSYTHLTLPTKA